MNETRARRILAAAGCAVLGAVIALQSLSPHSTPAGLDKAYHFSAYAVWAFLAVFAARTRLRLWLFLAAVLAAGVAVEILQPYFGRDGNIKDALANLAGVGVGGFAGMIWRSRSVPRLVRRWGLPVFGVGGVAISAAALASMWYADNLDNWDCYSRLFVGDEVTGGRPWEGDVLCARLYAGGRSMSPSGHEGVPCGQPLTRPGAVAALEIGAGSANGIPETPLKSEETKAFCFAAQKSQSLLFDIWLRADKASQSGPARILTFSRSLYKRDFTLSQQGSAFDLRLRTRSTGFNGDGTRMRSPKGSVAAGEVQRVTVWYRNPEVTIFVDGKGSGPFLVGRTVMMAANLVMGAWLLAGGLVMIIAALWGGGLWWQEHRAAEFRRRWEREAG